MRLRFLIDGYNLIHALGFLDAADGPRALEQSRRRLLEHLHGALSEGDALGTTVVFDARRSPPGVSPHQSYHGIRIRFAVEQQVADDEIEALLHADADAGSLAVVTNDQRLLEAARRRKARAWTCERFLDHLDRPPEAAKDKTSDERRTAGEPGEWVEEFKDLADDPGFKELFDPYPFDDEPPKG